MPARMKSSDNFSRMAPAGAHKPVVLGEILIQEPLRSARNPRGSIGKIVLVIVLECQ